MPLKLNVGLSQKMGEPNYGSRGASVNVEMELESTLASDAAKLQERIRQLFGVVRASVVEELRGKQPAPAIAENSHASSNGQQSGPGGQHGSGHDNGSGHHNGGGQHNGSGHQNGNGRAPEGAPPHGQPPVRPATPSQVKAIYAIARSQKLDVSQFLRERFDRERPEDLSLTEASDAIDDLKRKE